MISWFIELATFINSKQKIKRYLISKHFNSHVCNFTDKGLCMYNFIILDSKKGPDT